MSYLIWNLSWANLVAKFLIIYGLEWCGFIAWPSRRILWKSCPGSLASASTIESAIGELLKVVRLLLTLSLFYLCYVLLVMLRFWLRWCRFLWKKIVVR